MFKLFIPIISILFALSSCDSSNQYDIHVANKTENDLRISYKSMKDRRGPIEETIVLKKNESRVIISTTNIESAQFNNGPTSAQCYQAAEYVQAYMHDTIPSSIKWCSDPIKFQIVDIGQAEFLIDYTSEDFKTDD